MLNNKKGFTLIELLAIIVILAIIAVITVPIILNVIDNAKRGTAKDSAYGYKDAINKYYVSGMLNDNYINLDGEYAVLDGKLGEYDIPFSGTKPTSGFMVYDNNVLIEGCIVINEYKVVFEGNEVKDAVKGSCVEVNEPEESETPVEPEEPVDPEEPVEPEVPQVSYKCKRATELHTDVCTVTNGSTYCYGAGYSLDGSKQTTNVSFGNLGSGSSIVTGDAFDCDVNGDGIFSSETERFYYVSDLYNTTTKEFDSDYAVLLFFSNVENSTLVNDSYHDHKYYTSNENWHGPVEGINYLPTVKEWSNVSLSNNVRAIIGVDGSSSTKGGDLPTEFTYSKVVDGESVPLAARFITSQELSYGCNTDGSITNNFDLEPCIFTMENTRFFLGVDLPAGYLIENPKESTNNGGYYIDGMAYRVGTSRYIYNSYGIRPVIEVPKSQIQLEDQ